MTVPRHSLMLQATPRIRIPDAELEERFIQSGGPGGQNVNKVATAVQLRFNVAASPSLPPDVRDRLLSLARPRINRDGDLVIDARRYRSQDRNRSDARERLARWITRAATPPRKRKATRPTRAARERRLKGKKQHARRKAMRRPPDSE